MNSTQVVVHEAPDPEMNSEGRADIMVYFVHFEQKKIIYSISKII